MPHKEHTPPQLGVPTKSFLNLNTSALYQVFGSQVSLAELTGDVPLSRPLTPVPTNNGTSSYSSSSQSTLDDDEDSGTGNSEHSLNRADKKSIYRRHHQSPQLLSFTGLLNLLSKITTLFLSGVAYGQLSKRLHDNHLLTNYTFDIDPNQVSLIWGTLGVLIGFLLPFVDYMFPEDRKKFHGKGGADWTSIVRAGAALVGIAYGVRKIPWVSTLQVAFYWALLNPCLWFLLDATRNGFVLSTFVALVGTKLFVLMYPDHVPDSAQVSEAYASVFTLVASAFFCCSISIGNLGRRLLSF